jgi:DNA-binding response OmpR family regulator
MTNLSDHTILLVEDEPVVLMDVQQSLEAAGAHVCAAKTVQEALQLLETQPITASVLDFKLHDRTAAGLCHQLTERKIPIVIYSGYPDIARELHKWEVVAKPAHPGELVNRVMKVLVAQAY